LGVYSDRYGNRNHQPELPESELHVWAALHLRNVYVRSDRGRVRPQVNFAKVAEFKKPGMAFLPH
jgi:hypothetical protein